MRHLAAKADIDLITDPVRAITPGGITYKTDPAVFLKADAESVKSIILYADSIRLRSYMFDLFQMGRYDDVRGRMPLQAILKAIKIAETWSEAAMRTYGIDPQSVLPQAIAHDFFEHWTEGEVDIDAIEEFRKRHWSELRPIDRAWFGAASDFAAREDWSELAPAIDAGLLTITGWSDTQPGIFEGEENYVDRASQIIYSLVTEGRQPLAFDQGAEMTLRLEQYGKKKDLELTKRLLAMMPTFSRASMLELIDIRRELDAPLARFRSAMIEIASDLPEPADRAYEQEVTDAYRRVIAPSLSEIDELTRENRYLNQLSDAAVDVRTWVPSAVGLGIGITAFTRIAQLSTAAAGLASIPLSALRAKSKKEGEIKQNRFFFLWRIKNLST